MLIGTGALPGSASRLEHRDHIVTEARKMSSQQREDDERDINNSEWW